MTSTPHSAGPRRFALIIGAMKSGTTSLFELLVQHPEIAGSRVKEPDFFVSGDPARRWREYLALWDWDESRHRIALEASTQYTKYPWVPGVPERIASCSGASFKFIYMVRDPVARIASQVRHGLFDGWGKSLDDGMTPDLLDFSRYAMQADRYMAHFPRHDLLILTLEELKASPEAVLKKVCRFLEVSDHSFVGADEPRNTGDLYTVPPLVARIAHNPVALWVYRNVLPLTVRSRLRRVLARLGKRQTERPLARWKLNPEEITYVREALSTDLARLRDEYGVQASWLPPAPSATPADPVG